MTTYVYYPTLTPIGLLGLLSLKATHFWGKFLGSKGRFFSKVVELHQVSDKISHNRVKSSSLW